MRGLRFGLIAVAAVAGAAGAAPLAVQTNAYNNDQPSQFSDPYAASGVTGPVVIQQHYSNGDVYASADYGVLKVGSSISRVAPGNMLSSAGTNAQASFADSASFGTLAGVTSGTMTFSFTIDGSEGGSASGGPYGGYGGVSFGSFDFDLSVTQNGAEVTHFTSTRSRSSTTAGSNVNQTVSINHALSLQQQSPFATWMVTVPFDANGSALGFSATARCSSSVQTQFSGNTAQSNCDVQHTITWNGLVSAFDQDGNAIGNIALQGQQGFNYAKGANQQQAQAAPEPGALALLGLGVLGIAGRRRRAA